MIVPTGQVLEPLRRRYLHWLGLSEDEIVDDRDEAEQDVRAMQLVIRLERDGHPSWHAAVRLELDARDAAQASLVGLAADS